VWVIVNVRPLSLSLLHSLSVAVKARYLVEKDYRLEGRKY